MSIYNNLNYHFNHNKLSDTNPFNYSYPQKQNQFTSNINANPTFIPSNTQPISQIVKNNINTYNKSSLYNASNLRNKYNSNYNPSSTMNYQDRVIAYGQDADENFFKHTLRKPIISNTIQSSSLGIINNYPKPISQGINRFDNSFIQKRDHVADLLGYSLGKNTYGYNYAQPISYNRNGYINDNESKVNEPYSMNNINNKYQRNTPNAYMYNNTPAITNTNEKHSKDISEYYEKNGSAIIEYAYKEDPNSQYRNYMEDKGKAIDCFKNDPNSALFCLFDGHGGGEVSKYLQDNIANEFKTIVPNDNLESSIISLFERIDDNIKKSNFFHVGSTACVVYITKEQGKRILYCANIGDTRCILLNATSAKRLSYDDRASDKNEYDRIINSGGIVFAGRVYGQLMLSRAFGDWELKSYGVINVPHITRMEIDIKDHYVVIASDGVWDVFSDDDIYKLSLSCSNADDLCKNIIKQSLLKGTMDNISCFVIRLN